MANPIRTVGRRDIDPVSEAQRQDRERREREDQAYFENTGIRRPPIIEINPLVDDDIQDVANDGDSYIDDAPSEIIMPPTSILNRPNIPSATIRNTVVDKITKTKKDNDSEELEKSLKKAREQINNTIEGLEI